MVIATTKKSGNDKEVRRILQGMGLSEAAIYDESGADESLYSDEIYSYLTPEEIEDAVFIRRFLRGLMLVTGLQGSGKGLLGHVIPYKIKRYFVGRKALLDHKPRSAFGPYLPFDEAFLHNELAKMAELSRVRIGEIPEQIDRKDKKRIKDISLLADKWVRSKEGEVYLKKSVLVLEEFKRYMHNRRPMNPLGITLGHIITWWRHLDMLIIGMTPFKREIDAISCLPNVTHEARCKWTEDGRACCDIHQTVWVGDKGVLNVEGLPVRIVIDGNKRWPQFDNIRFFDLYNSKFLPSTMK